MNEQLSVLLVDGDPDILELYERYLEDSFRGKPALAVRKVPQNWEPISMQ